MDAITLTFKNTAGFSDDEFYRFCLDNPELSFERTAQGQILIMPNTGGKTGNLNSEINFQLRGWNKAHRLGIVFDSSTSFRLPSGAVRSPDASWVRNDRWQALSEEEKSKFPHLCPDFVVELRSESDGLAEVQRKVETEWMAAGCRLAWLVDPRNQTVHVYRPGAGPHLSTGFDGSLDGGEVLPGFRLDLRELRAC